MLDKYVNFGDFLWFVRIGQTSLKALVIFHDFWECYLRFTETKRYLVFRLADRNTISLGAGFFITAIIEVQHC